MLPKEFGELLVFIFFHLTFLGNVLTISQDFKNVYSKLSTINSRLNQTMMFLTWLKPARIVRDTYDEREKLVSSYKLISKTQCLLTMSPWTGYVHAKRLNNIDDQDQSKNPKDFIEISCRNNDEGIFLFLPMAVNIFLIQHKSSERYLCAKQNQLFGSIDRDERQCLFEAKRSDIDFGHWDSFRLFYEDSNSGYLSISNNCQTRLRKKYFNDQHLDFLAFVRINTDRSSMNIFQPDQKLKIKSSTLIREYRHRLSKDQKKNYRTFYSMIKHSSS